MNKEAELLINAMEKGDITDSQLSRLEELIASGVIDLTDLPVLDRYHSMVGDMSVPDASPEMTRRFRDKLAEIKAQPARQSFTWLPGASLTWWKPALAVILLLGAFFIGRMSDTPSDSPRLESLSAEVHDMKEMLMLSMIKQESPIDRLKAVSLTSDIPSASHQVTDALLKTLRNDPNVNVRLAALDALVPYTSDPEVRTGLIASIRQQESPLVQLSLAEVMVALQEKRSVDSLRMLLHKKDIPDDVRTQLKKSIDILI